MAFNSTITSALFANSDEMGLSANVEKLRNRTAEKQLYFQDDQNPLAEAQKIADTLMSTKQRKTMVFEFLASKNNWVITTMYINPQRLQIQTQKIKSKQITRGGVYYHHHGDDHWTISLSGTTGFAQMKGIESLEKAYHASGTLLKYKTYGPEQIDIVAGSYGIIDYSDPIGVLDTFVTIQNPTVLGKIQAKYKEENNSSTKNATFVNTTGNALRAYADKIMDTYVTGNNHKQMMKKLEECQTLIVTWVNEFKNKNGRTPTATEYYNNYVAILQKNLKGGSEISPDVIVAFAYNETLSKYSYKVNSGDFSLTTDDLFKLNYSYAYSGSQYGGKDAFQQAVNDELNPVEVSGANQIRIIRESMERAGNSNLITDQVISSINSSTPENQVLISALELDQARTEALRNHLVEIADWEQRERNIQSALKAKAMETMDDLFNDEWAPRRLILYYENRAYIGHFDSFSYQRIADSPLISYDLRFTVEKQIVGKMY